VHLQIIHLCRQRTDRHIRDALKELPQGLEKSFERSLNQIEQLPDRPRSQAKPVLRWVICAARPLTLEELTEAVAIDEMDEVWDEDRLVNDGKSLIDDCANLICFRWDWSWHRDGPNTEVQLVHASVRDFFTNGSGSIRDNLRSYICYPLREAHTVLTESFYKYLSLRSGYAWKYDEYGYLIQRENRFAYYVSEFWPHHIRQADQDFQKQFCSILDSSQTTKKLLLARSVIMVYQFIMNLPV